MSILKKLTKIGLSSNDDKRLKTIYMINFDNYTTENKTGHNLKRQCIPDHPFRILTIRRSGSRKKNALLSLIYHQLDIDKIYLYTKNPYEAKY